MAGKGQYGIAARLLCKRASSSICESSNKSGFSIVAVLGELQTIPARLRVVRLVLVLHQLADAVVDDLCHLGRSHRLIQRIQRALQTLEVRARL